MPVRTSYAQGTPNWVDLQTTDQGAAKATELGGSVVVAPVDTPVGRMGVLGDPQGAVFSIITLAQPA